MELHRHLSPAPMQEPSPAPAPTGARGGWSDDETRLLWEQVRLSGQQGEPLREVFERVAAKLGRKPNSIRNYYYAQLKTHDEPGLKRALPFETFSEEEVRQLMRTVLQKKGEGMSVRACVTEMAGGDKALMLRYQNKYRSTLRARPDLVAQVLEELKAQGLPGADPYAPKAPRAGCEELFTQTAARVERTGEAALYKMLEGMNAHIDMAFKDAPPQAASPAQNDALERALVERDRLSARNDLLRIALSEEREKNEQLQEKCEQLVLSIKEFIGQSEFSRAQHIGDFCQELSGRLCTLEQTLPFARE